MRPDSSNALVFVMIDSCDIYFSYRMAGLAIYFFGPQVTTLERSESQTVTDALANCGGLLGLFMGISVLSIIEFFYYASLRLYWTIRRSRTETDVVLFERTPNNRINVNSNRESFVENRKNETNQASKLSGIYPFTH